MAPRKDIVRVSRRFLINTAVLLSAVAIYVGVELWVTYPEYRRTLLWFILILGALAMGYYGRLIWREWSFSRGRKVPTVRGDFVRSRAEAAIADFLHHKGLKYEYEPFIQGYRPDFYLPEFDVIIEYWGLSNPEYMKRRRRKTAAYRDARYWYINLEGDDYKHLEETLQRKLYAKDKRIYDRPFQQPDGRK